MYICICIYIYIYIYIIHNGVDTNGAAAQITSSARLDKRYSLACL